MNARRTTAVAAGLAAVLVPIATAVPAQSQAPRGTTPLAEVLAADGLEFDDNWRDFDILDQAVNDVIAAKPESAVAVLTDGSVKLTAFAPTDRAFRKLVADLAGEKPADEQATYDVLATVGVDTVESVLLYHVVPGAPITYAAARRSDGARLTTANGATLKVNVRKKSGRVHLKDRDRGDANAFVLPALKNINKGNRQIAHGVSEVLRPIDL